MLTAAQSKLTAALPAALRGRVGRVRDRFHLDAPGWYREAEPAPFLPAIADAVWNSRRLSVRYHRWAHPQDVERLLDPYGLVLKAGVWYLVAACEGTVRTYRVSQILALEPTGTGFVRSDGFDLAAHWQTYLAQYDARRFRLSATLRLPAEVLPDLAERLEAAAYRSVETTATAADEAGLITAVIPLESPDHAVPTLLALGPRVEVLDPPELRARVAEAVALLHEMYR